MRHYARYIWALAVILALCGAPVAHAAHAHAVSVSTFYATSIQAYNNWGAATHYAPPPPQTAFAAGTGKVAFYFKYAGAGKNSGFYVVLRQHVGATVTVSGWWRLSAGAHSEMVSIPAPDGTFPNGSYDADLVIDYHRLATITFSVGGAGGGAGDASGVTISAFLSTTSAAVTGWVKQSGLYPLPARATRFAAGTNKVWFVFVFKGATPKVTTAQIVAQGANGLKLSDRAKPYPLSYEAGGIYSALVAPQHLAFPNGSYTAVLLIDGQPAAQTAFTIG